MNYRDTFSRYLPAALALLGLSLLLSADAWSQDSKAPVVDSGKEVISTAAPMDRGLETEMDLPSDFHRYYGQRVNQWRDIERKIAKLDIDTDMNYDGTIDNSDPADNGAFESTPPGMMVGEGELTRVLIRLTPYRIDYRGQVVLTLEVAGVNRADKSGQFASFEEETASTGRIRVWKDASQRELLLDSADPEKRYYEWTAEESVYPANLPGAFPRFVYVEGVSAAGAAKGLSAKQVVEAKGVVGGGAYYSGDLRLLATVSHREEGAERETYPEYRKRFLKSYRTTFDHILFTVLEQPQEKVFINNNAEGVWISGAGK
jgi:hypothetical protein